MKRGEHVTNRNDGATADLVMQLIDRDPSANLHDDQLDANSEALDAAFAIGIAVGLLLRPNAFPGGAR
jgi:hypothetical protein